MKSYSSMLGYVLVGFLTYITITKGTNNPSVFLNIEGIGIVCGGLIVAGMASFPGPVLWQALRSGMRALVNPGHVSPQTAEQVVQLATAYKRGMPFFERAVEDVKSPYLKTSANLILEGIGREIMADILDKRTDEIRMKTQIESNVFLTLSKYSPALGLSATVLGLVNILGQLGTAEMSVLGAGMAIALSGTFYGIFMSNLVFMPLGELASGAGESEARESEMVRVGILSILEGQDPLVVGELVNSYLKTENRLDFTQSGELNPSGTSSLGKRKSA